MPFSGNARLHVISILARSPLRQVCQSDCSVLSPRLFYLCDVVKLIVIVLCENLGKTFGGGGQETARKRTRKKERKREKEREKERVNIVGEKERGELVYIY